MKITTPPVWLTNLKDWLYGISVIIGVPSIFMSFLASHIEAKKFGLQYLQDNFLLALYIAVITTTIIFTFYATTIIIKLITRYLNRLHTK